MPPFHTDCLPDHLRERLRPISDRAINQAGEFVLYWMHHAVRGHENPALDVALHAAARSTAVARLSGACRPASIQRRPAPCLILEGARDAHASWPGVVSARCSICRGPGSAVAAAELAARAALVVTEDFPAPPFPAWTRASRRVSRPRSGPSTAPASCRCGCNPALRSCLRTAPTQPASLCRARAAALARDRSDAGGLPGPLPFQAVRPIDGRHPRAVRGLRHRS